MRHEEAVHRFREIVTGMNPKDKAAIGEAWSVFIDRLHRSGDITDRQAQNWCLPSGFTLPSRPDSGDVWRRRRDGATVSILYVEDQVVYFEDLQGEYSLDVRQFMQDYAKSWCEG